MLERALVAALLFGALLLCHIQPHAAVVRNQIALLHWFLDSISTNNNITYVSSAVDQDLVAKVIANSCRTASRGKIEIEVAIFVSNPSGAPLLPLGSIILKVFPSFRSPRSYGSRPCYRLGPAFSVLSSYSNGAHPWKFINV